MMKRNLLLILFIISISFLQQISAQTPQQIGFVNSDEILDVMPEKKEATKMLTDLNNAYKAEMKTMETEYKKKYSDFITYQNTMGDNVRLRRMQDLYELERRINEFMELAQEDIKNQEKRLLAPLRNKIKDAIKDIGNERQLYVIYDLANPTITFVTPNGVNVTKLVKEKLGVKD